MANKPEYTRRWRKNHPEKYALYNRISRRKWLARKKAERLARGPIIRPRKEKSIGSASHCRTCYNAYHRKYKAIRRGREKRAEGKYTCEDVNLMVLSQLGLCSICLVQLKEFHVDHIVPLSRGGSNLPSNLQLLCPRCNRRKSNKTSVR